MKKIILIALTCLCTLAAAAQSAFTIEANDTTYSFGLDSKITLTDNPLWNPADGGGKTTYKSAYKSLRLNFRSTYSTASQSNTKGIDYVSPCRLIADSLWAVDFKVNDYRRVVFSVNAEDSTRSVSDRIACCVEDFDQRCGHCEVDSFGRGYRMKYFGENGEWTYLFNERLMQFALIHKTDGSPELAAMKDTITQKVDYSKIIDIDNVTDTWYADGVFNGQQQKLAFKFKADPITNKAFSWDGIDYSIQTGRTVIKYPIPIDDEYEDDVLYGEFPDEFDYILKDSVADFDIYDTGFQAERYGIHLTTNLTDDTAAPDVYVVTKRFDHPTLTILDRNRFQMDNGIVMLTYKTDGTGKKEVIDWFKVPAGSILYRDGSYPTPAKVDTVLLTKTDTIYINKVETITQYKASASLEEIIEAGKTLESKLSDESAFYDLTDNEIHNYAELYQLALRADTTGISDAEKKQYLTALEQLRRASLASQYIKQQLVSPANRGKYLVLGTAGSAIANMVFGTQKLVLGTSTDSNAATGVMASGYVAWAKQNVYKGDTTVFVANAKGDTFVSRTMAQKAPTFAGIDTIDVYVLYTPYEDHYTPVYVARKGGLLVEQWKGTTRNFYTTLDDAVAHLGTSTANMTDRLWFAADYAEGETREAVITAGTSLDPLYNKFTNFQVLYTGEGNSTKNITGDGVSIDASATPFTFTKNGAACNFTGVAFFRADNAKGEPYVIALLNISNKYYAYAYKLNK